MKTIPTKFDWIYDLYVQDEIKKKKNKNMKVSFKKLNTNAVIPSYSKPGDAGLDLVASSCNITEDQITYGTGISLEIPQGYVGLLFPRSSIRKYDLTLSNSVGVIDSGYRGEIQLTFNKTDYHDTIKYEIGDRIGQITILPYPTIELVESDVLTETERGEGGFGSTGS